MCRQGLLIYIDKLNYEGTEYRNNNLKIKNFYRYCMRGLK